MKDYTKMINTVNAIQQAFGSKEFSACDYRREIGSENDCYCVSRVCNDNAKNIMVKKVREEDFITHDKHGKKIVATRYFYEVNTDFVKELKNSLRKDIERLYNDIETINRQIQEKKQRIEEKEELLAAFEAIIDNVKAD